MIDRKTSFETRAIHADKQRTKPSAGDPVIYPRVNSTVFRMSAGNDDDIIYTRHDNPNRRQLEAVLSSLEGGVACAAFSSGMAASTAIVQSLLPGDHVLIPENLYHGTRKLMQTIMKPWGLKSETVDMTRPELLEKAVRPETRLVWVETPSNPLLQITDIAEVAAICKRQNLLLVVDNTWPSPVNQQPLLLGADLVMHSTSKYIGGHSDLLGGAVIAKSENEFFDKIRDIQRSAGAVPSPDDCWLMLRSIRTLPYRMKGHNEHAGVIAEYLEQRSSVEKVYYPGLKGHPGHAVAKKQMCASGGMISFLVKGDRDAAARVVQGSSLIAPVTSLGGVESTWEHRIRSEGPDTATPANLIRLSVGLEHPDDLIADIELAFQQL
ncbi:MAG: aminotransferase class I/II-fold pyridoxal phosphate-dependent enzyme [Balneolaceae bacterium]